MKRILAVGAICLALSACSGTPDAAVSPSVSVTAGTPTPSVSDPAKDPLYLEAVEVYEKYLAESFKLERAGGAATLPAVFDDFLVGTYRDTIEELYQKTSEAEIWMAASPDPKVRFGSLPGVSRSGSDVALEVCVDATGVDILGPGNEVVHRGALIHRQLFFSRSKDGVLRASSGSAKGV
ncbi:MAG TPA: hypothetical protein VLR88_02085, partial [Propionibacteriaceae bacterium]|nr:hypothetical protein [Propionibacteriaceae bacterium]